MAIIFTKPASFLKRNPPLIVSFSLWQISSLIFKYIYPALLMFKEAEYNIVTKTQSILLHAELSPELSEYDSAAFLPKTDCGVSLPVKISSDTYVKN